MRTKEEFEEAIQAAKAKLEKSGYRSNPFRTNSKTDKNWGNFDLPYSTFPKIYSVSTKTEEKII